MRRYHLPALQCQVSTQPVTFVDRRDDSRWTSAVRIRRTLRLFAAVHYAQQSNFSTVIDNAEFRMFRKFSGTVEFFYCTPRYGLGVVNQPGVEVKTPGTNVDTSSAMGNVMAETPNCHKIWIDRATLPRKFEAAPRGKWSGATGFPAFVSASAMNSNMGPGNSTREPSQFAVRLFWVGLRSVSRDVKYSSARMRAT